MDKGQIQQINHNNGLCMKLSRISSVEGQYLKLYAFGFPVNMRLTIKLMIKHSADLVMEKECNNNMTGYLTYLLMINEAANTSTYSRFTIMDFMNINHTYIKIR